ncbi:transglycosylase domain-containing protein [Streptomyces sp. MUM 178J]|uniref:transglycosylase domain-containing protein n=1 Tax=Streptomyces sp. MUM 178J TaxID=2791991 RepID=UPI001F040612|nr:transglycosylase domain-containing protein [Streptomyces sp. MUM 178J]WRQ77993.1 transglycosylase domain-containing protein [Streptomyces sp. MUM 178J]
MFLGFAAVAGLVSWVYATTTIPDPNADAQAEATVYYWADGTQMVSAGPVNRQSVPLSEIPLSLQNAAIAAENADFRSDPGFSVSGLARAAVNVVRGGELQGGSTITQQYVKNTFLTQEQSVERKLRELCLAVKLSRSRSKDQILQGYLNTSWFGRNSYGVQAAARAYYGTDVRQLDPSRSALLVALLKNGDLHDPALGEEHRRRAEARWRYVLDRQVELGLMTREERAAYSVFPEPRPREVANGLAGQVGYLVDAANKDLRNRAGLTPEALGRGGYHIRTTFDRAAVERLRRAVEGAADEALDPALRAADGDVQFGAASVRTADGSVLALYGGPDATRHFASNADTAGVPVGSAFKPFVLAAALEQGDAARGEDRAVAGSGLLDTAVPPLAGVDEVTSSGTLALRRALVRGDRDAFRRLGSAVGPRQVRNVAIASGLLPHSMAEPDSSFALGTSTPSAIRMAGAYATFAREGQRTAPYSVASATYRGAPLEGLERPGGRQVMAPQTARELTRALRDVAVDAVDAGTLRSLGPIAAGRTDDGDRLPAAWFVGYGEELSTAVTVFRSDSEGGGLLPLDEPVTDAAGRGDTLPLRVWSTYMKADREQASTERTRRGL